MAFKMNYNRDSFPYKDMGLTKQSRYGRGPTKQGRYDNGPTMRDDGYPKYNHDRGFSRYSDTHMSKAIAKAKPDFFDADGDGDKKEPMKKAFEDKKNDGPPMRTPYEKHGGTKPQSQMTEDELAEHKGIKKPQSQRIPQGDFEPMFMGGDISQEEFDKMSKKEQKEYMEKYSAT